MSSTSAPPRRLVVWAIKNPLLLSPYSSVRGHTPLRRKTSVPHLGQPCQPFGIHTLFHPITHRKLRSLGINVSKRRLHINLLTTDPPLSLPFSPQPSPCHASRTACVAGPCPSPASCSPTCSAPHTTYAVPRSAPSATPSSSAQMGTWRVRNPST